VNLASKPSSPIGVFDSGVGGLSVLKAIRQELPRESVIYLADQAHVPYGPRPLDEVRQFSHQMTQYLLAREVKLIVVACNAASAAALLDLRKSYPETPFVGMEPAVKPAAETTRSGQVGVLATPATFQGALYASVIERFADGVNIFQDTCPGLVALIEAGELRHPATRAILNKALTPMLAAGIDTVVLGCTHYPFVIPLIQEIAGPEVRVIDPAPAVARQVRRVLGTNRWLSQEGRETLPKARVEYLTSGDPGALQTLLPLLVGESGKVGKLVWRDGQLVAPPILDGS
jgi:glutamate racemase